MNLPDWLKMPFQKQGTATRLQADAVQQRLNDEIEKLKRSMEERERKKGVTDGPQ